MLFFDIIAWGFLAWVVGARFLVGLLQHAYPQLGGKFIWHSWVPVAVFVSLGWIIYRICA